MDIVGLQNHIAAAESECGAISMKLQAEFLEDMDERFCRDVADCLGDVESDVAKLIDVAESLADNASFTKTFDKLQEILGDLEAANGEIDAAQQLMAKMAKAGANKSDVGLVISSLDRACELLDSAANA